ncbi:UNKNOWN [Stylonychia lemnae]|uniref:Uncharacterized protein n=1 Tax=Stylonychia lemnae TaxID=5949 RepID=A0A078A666_STYLE|nr:UNKNOWN [Stylonychia lemnae]|eukprot:CDW77694.1 UNKNOWN [Stylonychia lemnae]
MPMSVPSVTSIDHIYRILRSSQQVFYQSILLIGLKLLAVSGRSFLSQHLYHQLAINIRQDILRRFSN